MVAGTPVEQVETHRLVQDGHDPCLFANTELDIRIGVHVDDMLAVGPSESKETSVAGTRERHGNALGYGD